MGSGRGEGGGEVDSQYLTGCQVGSGRGEGGGEVDLPEPVRHHARCTTLGAPH